MTFLRTLFVVFVISTISNACVVDMDKSWAYHYTDNAYDAATANAPLNDKYNCFAFCPETGVSQSKFLVKPTPLNKVVATMEREPTQRDSYGSYFICTDISLQTAIEQSLSKLTKFTAKDIATSLQYSLNKPGWVINVIKHTWKSQYFDGTVNDYNFCQYETTLNGEYVTIQMGLVDTN